MEEKAADDGLKMQDIGPRDSPRIAELDDTVMTAAQNRRLLLKTDLVVMPLIILCMTLAFLDKVHTLCDTPMTVVSRLYLTELCPLECSRLCRPIRDQRRRTPARSGLQLAQ